MSKPSNSLAVFILLIIVVGTMLQAAVILTMTLYQSRRKAASPERGIENRGLLGMMTVVFLVLIVVVIFHSIFIVELSRAPITSESGSNLVKKEPASFGEDVIKQSIAGIFTLVGALIGATVAYISFRSTLETNTKNTFVSLILTTNSLRDELDNFLSALKSGNRQDFQEYRAKPTIAVLYSLKPEVMSEVDKIFEDENLNKAELTRLSNELLKF